jgi:hypothetical protein
VFKVVPGVFRVIWLALSIISAAIGVSMLVASAFARSYDFGMFLGNGLGFLWGSLMFLISSGPRALLRSVELPDSAAGDPGGGPEHPHSAGDYGHGTFKR